MYMGSKGLRPNCPGQRGQTGHFPKLSETDQINPDTSQTVRSTPVPNGQMLKFVRLQKVPDKFHGSQSQRNFTQLEKALIASNWGDVYVRSKQVAAEVFIP